MDLKTKLAQLSPGKIAVAGVPFDAYSSYMRGAALAPERIRRAFHSDSANYFSESGVDLKNHPNLIDLGDLEIDQYFSIQTQVEEILRTGAKLLSWGGDHSITYPIIRAFAGRHKKITILQLDAHGDLYDNFENNPHSHASPFARIMEEGLVKKLIQVGNRTLSTHQREQAKRFGVTIIEMKHFHSVAIPDMEDPLYISLDMDCFDPAFAPGVSHHEPGGLTSREVIQIIQDLRVSIIGADIVEYNPNRDLNDMTAMLAAKVFKEIVDKMLKNG